jgi:LAO/AO transport system kinase
MLDVGENVHYKIHNQSHNVEIIHPEGWRPPIIKTNAITGENIEELIKQIDEHKNYLIQHHILEERLKMRYRSEIRDILKMELSKKVEEYLNNPKIDALIEEIVAKNQDPYSCAFQILHQKIKFEE